MSEGSSSPGAEAVAPPEEAADPLVGKVIADRYRVDERLGVGGMGAVYRAEHVLMKKSVAVKVLHREMTVLDEVVKRFEREAIAAGRIEHPNVTVATDFGKLDDGSFYLVLEYVAGRSLTQALTEGPMPVERALFIARQVAAGLGAAHAAGIVHRDLKPDNIMLIERGGTKDFVKVLDFGIAKVSAEAEGGSQLTRLGSVFGTPAYMAPEQAAGKSVDQRADLYALGLVTHEMLAGKPTFEAEEVMGLLAKQLTEPAPPLPDTVDPGAAALVARLLEKDPDARFRSAEELIAAIDSLVGPAAPSLDGTVIGVPSLRGGTAAISATVVDGLAAPARQRTLSAPGQPTSSLLQAASRSLRIGGRDVPYWLLGGAGAALLAAAIGLGRGHGTPHSAAPAPPELGPVIARAEVGDRAAIAQLSARPEASRTAAEWMAIGKGDAHLSAYASSIEAFRNALRLDPALAEDREMLGDVRRAVDDDAAQKQALDVAAGSLGSPGADILFDVWASTTEKNQTTALAKSLLEREDVLAHASKALKVALDLRRASRCDELKKLIVEAKENADERAVRRLTQLSSRKGCGFLGLGDCFSCLRQDDSLGDALKAAQARKAPKF